MIDQPTTATIATTRHQSGHTQVQAAAAVGVSVRTWQDWELGQSAIPLAAWWLYLLRVGRVRLSDLPAVPERQRAAVR
jgi:DNA-binding transcriptional regulator YiaG